MNHTLLKSRNHILVGLPTEDWQIWESELKPIHLTAGDVLSDSGIFPQHVYFPHSSIISLTHILEDGESIEVAMVGTEGMLGVCVFLGNQAPSTRAIVLRSGLAYRLRASLIRQTFNSSELAKQAMLRYTQSLISQISQIGACSKHHSLEQQVCRWLLLYLDRSEDMHIKHTQEMLSLSLGVRRERISHIAKKFQQQGILSYTRGNIIIHNRDALINRSCTCYEIISTNNN